MRLPPLAIGLLLAACAAPDTNTTVDVGQRRDADGRDAGSIRDAGLVADAGGTDGGDDFDGGWADAGAPDGGDDFDAGWADAGSGDAGVIASAMPDFSLQDMNPASTTGGQRVTPRSQLGHISGWYFAHAT